MLENLLIILVVLFATYVFGLFVTAVVHSMIVYIEWKENRRR